MMTYRKRLFIILAISLVSFILFYFSAFSRLTQGIHPMITNVPSLDKYRSSYTSKYAFALKTGYETGANRVPILLLTYLQHFGNVFYFSDQYTRIGNIGIEGILKNVDEMKKQGNKGWDLDQVKFFPGFTALYERFPKAEWYIMLDDDTYLFFDNLKYYLSKYDPLKDHYMGSGRLETSCPITLFKNQTMFGMGGAGVILSRSAMIKLYNNMDKCKKYETCGYGDGALAECLREIGLLFDNALYDVMNGESPEDLYYSWQEDACLLPITFHHVKPFTVQKLYEIDRINPDNHGHHNPVTYYDVYKALGSKGINHRDKKIIGNSFSEYETDNIQYCIEECQRTAKCKGWTLDSASHSCKLFDLVKRLKEAEGLKSGLFGYSCNTKADMF